MQRILHDQFVILSAKTGKRIDPRTWGDAVKAGIHVQQAMTAQTDDRELSNGNLACPWPLCLGSIAKDKVWFVFPLYDHSHLFYEALTDT